MLPERKQLTFSLRYPEVWREILGNLKGCIEQQQGEFISATVFPIAPGLRTSTGAGDKRPFKISVNLSPRQFREEARYACVVDAHLLFISILIESLKFPDTRLNPVHILRNTRINWDFFMVKEAPNCFLGSDNGET
jgi:hypothetical protein